MEMVEVVLVKKFSQLIILSFFALLLVFPAIAASNEETNAMVPECKNLYWFDNSSTECGYKEFCGTYMYYGLRTFETKEENAKKHSRN